MSPAVSRRSMMFGGGAVAVGAVLDAFAIEPNWLDISHHEAAIEGLPRALDGFTI